jgi:uncharacterized membrane protein YozB (DUF420 family)
MDYYQIAATISLILQIVTLFLLFAGVGLKVRKKFRQHGIIMLTAVVLHTIIVLAWMVPSFSSSFSGSINFADMIVVTILVHAFMGIAADLLGIWLVASWRLRVDMKTCFAKKSLMRFTMTLWLITLFLGVVLYLKIMQIF